MKGKNKIIFYSLILFSDSFLFIKTANGYAVKLTAQNQNY